MQDVALSAATHISRRMLRTKSPHGSMPHPLPPPFSIQLARSLVVFTSSCPTFHPTSAPSHGPPPPPRQLPPATDDAPVHQRHTRLLSLAADRARAAPIRNAIGKSFAWQSMSPSLYRSSAGQGHARLLRDIETSQLEEGSLVKAYLRFLAGSDLLIWSTFRFAASCVIFAWIG